jgi:hypothetical protein
MDKAVVIDELLRAWRRSDDPEDYARTVLADVDFGDLRLEVGGWQRVCCLRHLKRLTNVACYGDFGSLEPVAAAPSLRQLELIQNEALRDLRPLTRSRTLRTLVLTSGCEFLRDLSPLADTGIQELRLRLVRAALGSLRTVRLRTLRIRDGRISGGLEPLPAELPLRELIVDNLPGSRSLVGVERWPGLETVSIVGAPRPEEVEALARLPRLRRLIVQNVPAAERNDAVAAVLRHPPAWRCS